VNHPKIRQLAFALLPFALAGLLTGCGGPPQYTVSGEVKVNGVPLEKGTISFAPAEGKGHAASAEIQNGHYEVRTTAGKKVVQISAPIVTGKRKAYSGPDAPMMDMTAESLPARYHTKSELTFDVQTGSNSKDWLLDVKKP